MPCARRSSIGPDSPRTPDSGVQLAMSVKLLWNMPGTRTKYPAPNKPSYATRMLL